MWQWADLRKRKKEEINTHTCTTHHQPTTFGYRGTSWRRTLTNTYYICITKGERVMSPPDTAKRNNRPIIATHLQRSAWQGFPSSMRVPRRHTRKNMYIYMHMQLLDRVFFRIRTIGGTSWRSASGDLQQHWMQHFGPGSREYSPATTTTTTTTTHRSLAAGATVGS